MLHRKVISYSGDYDAVAELKSRQEFATREATKNGFSAAIKTAVVWVPINLLLRRFSPFYNQRFSVSAKTVSLFLPLKIQKMCFILMN